MVKASRGDLDVAPDTGIDDVSVQGFYRPCWLFVPNVTFSPADLPSLVLWLRPETMGALGTVQTQWNDSSGLLRHAVLGSGAPTVVATGLDGGYRALRFTGGAATDRLLAPVSNNDATRTIYVVVKAAATPGGAICGWGNSAYLNVDSSQFGWNNLEGAGTQGLGGTPLNTWNLVTVRMNSLTSMSTHINGGGALTFDPDNAYQDGTQANLAIGNRIAADAPLIGDLLELIVFDAVHGTSGPALVNVMRGYFSRKYPTLGSFGT